MTSELTTSGRTYGQKSAEERHGARRARLLGAALELFGTRGYSDTSIGQLCSAASVSTRNFYEHFASREELLVVLHDEINAEAREAVVLALADIDPNDLPARAHAGVGAYVERMTSDRRRARIGLIETVGVSRETEGHRQAAIQRFADLIELEANRLAGDGLIPKRDFGLVVIALVGAINGLMNTWTVEPDWDARADDVVGTAADLIVIALSGS